MRTLLQPYFLFFTLIASTIYLFQITYTKTPSFINNFTNDLICLPLVLTICLFVVRLIKKDSNIVLNTYEIVSVFLLYSILFEVVFPVLYLRYTSDIWDVFMYFIGSIIFYIFWNKPLNK